MNIKEKYLNDNRMIFNCIKEEDLTVNEMSLKFGFTEQVIRSHLKRLYDNGFVSRSKNKDYLAINIDLYEDNLKEQLAKYNYNIANKNINAIKNHTPLHIIEAIKRGLISPDIIHTYSPLDDTPEKFKNNLNRVHKNMAWSGYSIYNML